MVGNIRVRHRGRNPAQQVAHGVKVESLGPGAVDGVGHLVGGVVGGFAQLGLEFFPTLHALLKNGLMSK